MNEAENMVTCTIIIFGESQIVTADLIKINDKYFASNPLADRPRQPALVQLDPTRLVEPVLPGLSWNYKGILLEIRLEQEEQL